MTLKFLYQYLLVQLLIWKNVAVEIEIVFAGDYKNIYKEYETGGGVGRVSTLVQNKIFVYVGNIMQAADKEKAEMAQKILDHLNCSAVILGKEELYLNPEDLDTYVKTTRNLISSVNLEHKSISLHQQKIITVGSIMFAILGYTTETVEAISTNTNFHVKNIIQSLNEKVRHIQLTYSKVRLIIAAGCAGIEIAKEIATRTSSINVVLSSGSRSLLWHDNNPPENMYKYGDLPLKIKNRDGNEVIVLHSFGSTRFLGKLTATLDTRGIMVNYKCEMIDIPLSVAEDSVLTELVKDQLEAPLIPTGPIGKSRVYLDGTCSKSECNLGNLITDSFVQYVSDQYNGEYWTDAPVGIIQGSLITSNINASVLKGILMAEDVNSVMEEEYDLIKITVTGEDLYRCFEFALDIKTKHGTDRFLQVSGLRIIFDTRRQRGDRIIDFKARCAKCEVPAYEPVKRNETYNVITMQDFPFHDYKLKPKTGSMVDINFSNKRALVYYIKQRKFVAAGTNDRIIQQPVYSSTSRYLWKSTNIMTINQIFSFIYCTYPIYIILIIFN